MPVSVDCPSCKGRLLFPDSLWQQRFAQRVQRLKCKKCGDVVSIDGRSAGLGSDAELEEDDDAEATIRMLLPAFMGDSWAPASPDLPPAHAPPTPVLVQEPPAAARAEPLPAEVPPARPLQAEPVRLPAQPAVLEQPSPAPLARRKIPLPDRSAAPARSPLLLAKQPAPSALLRQPASPARLEGPPAQQPAPPAPPAPPLAAAPAQQPAPPPLPAQIDPAPERPSAAPPRRTLSPSRPATPGRVSRIPARPAQGRLSLAPSVVSAQLNAAVALEEVPPWESAPSQEAPAQSSIESRVSLVSERSEPPRPSADPKLVLPPAEAKPESAIVQVASLPPIPSEPRASRRTSTLAGASSVSAKPPRRGRGRWLALSGLAVVALLSVRACLPGNTDHRQPPPRAATLDVGAPSPAGASVALVTPPSLPLSSAPIPESATEAATAPPPADSLNAADSTVLPKKLGSDPRAVPARRADHKPSAGEDAAPAENVPPYDKATLVQALNAAVQKAEQCDLWGRTTGTAKLFVTFAPTGRVTDARLVGEPLESSAVARCILHHARGASLPPFNGPEFTISRKITLR